MKIVSFKICPFVQRVTALLEAKEVPYEVEYIELDDKPGWFLEASPNAQVPILFTDDARVLFESDAIVEYIDEVAGVPLYPADPVEKARERAWSYLGTKHYLVQCSAQRSPDAATLDQRAQKLATAFGRVEQRLGDAKLAGGDTPGMVDIAWLPLLHRAAIVEGHCGWDLLDGLPQAKRWQEALLGTGLAERSVAEDFEERFAAFYLSGTTHLGRLASDRQGCARESDAGCTAKDMACCC